MTSLRTYLYFLILGSLITTGAVCAEQLRVIGWNVESGGARPEVLDNVIADMQGVDIWGFSEVQNSTWVDLFEIAAEDGENANFNTIIGTTGGGDKLLIVYDDNRFELVNQFELDHINIGGNVRAPLVAKMRLRSTGKEFLFMVNHLYRSKADRRHEQAQLLNEWAQNQTLPVIAVGDYNFDCKCGEWRSRPR